MSMSQFVVEIPCERSAKFLLKKARRELGKAIEAEEAEEEGPDAATLARLHAFRRLIDDAFDAGGEVGVKELGKFWIRTSR